MNRIALALFALLASVSPALAHPHILISSIVRFIEKDGQFTHVEIEWRFDPMASSIEIMAADGDRDGKLSPKESKALGDVALSELKGFGYLTWLSTGEKDFRPPKAPTFHARIADPAVFVPEDWAPTADPPGGRMAKPGAPAKPAAKVETKARRFRASSMSSAFRWPIRPRRCRWRRSIPRTSSASRWIARRRTRSSARRRAPNASSTSIRR